MGIKEYQHSVENSVYNERGALQKTFSGVAKGDLREAIRQILDKKS